MLMVVGCTASLKAARTVEPTATSEAPSAGWTVVTAGGVLSGVLAPGESRELQLTFRPGGRAVGDYTASLQVFDAVLVLTDGGPANATRTMVYHIWEEAFVFLEMGYAAAVAWVLFFIVFLVTLLQWKLQQRWVHYEA